MAILIRIVLWIKFLSGHCEKTDWKIFDLNIQKHTVDLIGFSIALTDQS